MKICMSSFDNNNEDDEKWQWMMKHETERDDGVMRVIIKRGMACTLLGLSLHSAHQGLADAPAGAPVTIPATAVGADTTTKGFTSPPRAPPARELAY